MTPYLRFYLAVRESIESASEEGVNPKVLTIGTEQFAVLHDEDPRIYRKDREGMVFMGMDLQLDAAPCLIRIDGVNVKPPTIEAEPKDDVQIALFD